MKYMLSDITIAVKAFERPTKLNNCLKSIRKYYPDIKVIVADDSKHKTSNSLANEYYMLPYDSGISAGRNFLLDKIETPLMMFIDDDTLFTQGDCVESMLQPILDYPEINLVAGILRRVKYHGTYQKRDDELIRNFREHRRTIGKYNIYDFVINLFIAKAESLRRVRWDNDLKICEHTNFFFRGMNELVCTIAKGTSFINDNKNNDQKYIKLRHGRIHTYIEKQFKSLGVTKFTDLE